MSARIPQHELTTQLVDAGNHLHTATSELDKRDAAIKLLKLRLTYFTGTEEGPFRGHELDELCAKLGSVEVRYIMDWCWEAYSGGMANMKRFHDEQDEKRAK